MGFDAHAALVFAVGLLATVVSGDVVKIWRHNTSWSNGDNWSLGAPPSDDMMATFPDAFDALTVALPAGKTRVSTLDLPSDGVLMLPRDGELRVTGSDIDFLEAIFREENQFVRTEPFGWLDPDNWLPEGDTAVADLVAVPHAERIPCSFEIAVLPADASFAILLPEVPVTVAGVRLGSQEAMSDAEWREVLGSNGGLAMLRADSDVREGAVTVKRRGGGGDAEGVCSPARDPRAADALQEAVCRYARPRCVAPPCLAPVRPRGHCCDVCGGVVLAEASRRTRVAAVLRAVARRLRREGLAARVVAHVGLLPGESRRVPRRLQVVLAERGEYVGDAAAAANALLNELHRNAALGLGAAYMEAAGPPARAWAWTFVGGSVFGTLFGVLVLFAAIFVTFHGWREVLSLGAVQGGSFVFARFENADTESEAVEVVANVQQGSGQAFHNPMYEQQASESAAGASTLQYSQLQEQEQDSSVTDTSQSEPIVETKLVDIDIKPTES